MCENKSGVVKRLEKIPELLRHLNLRSILIYIHTHPNVGKIDVVLL